MNDSCKHGQNYKRDFEETLSIKQQKLITGPIKPDHGIYLYFTWFI